MPSEKEIKELINKFKEEWACPHCGRCPTCGRPYWPQPWNDAPWDSPWKKTYWYDKDVVYTSTTDGSKNPQ